LAKVNDTVLFHVLAVKEQDQQDHKQVILTLPSLHVKGYLAVLLTIEIVHQIKVGAVISLLTIVQVDQLVIVDHQQIHQSASPQILPFVIVVGLQSAVGSTELIQVTQSLIVTPLHKHVHHGLLQTSLVDELQIYHPNIFGQSAP